VLAIIALAEAQLGNFSVAKQTFEQILSNFLERKLLPELSGQLESFAFL